MKDLEKTGFITPYPQPALDGELGLTSEDIAKVLNVRHDVVRTKLRRIDFDLWSNHEFVITPDSVQSENKRKKAIYVVNVKAAKAFVAKWDNPQGLGYLNYLFECERQAEKLVPRMRAALEAFMRPKRRRTSRGYMVTLQYPVYHIGLFGTECEIVTERKRFDDLTPEELHLYQMQHRQSVLHGLTEKQSNAIKNGKLLVLPGGKRE